MKDLWSSFFYKTVIFPYDHIPSVREMLYWLTKVWSIVLGWGQGRYGP